MIACGMCDLSPGLNTPIRVGCFGTRCGLLVTGTADDPLSVPSSTKRCHSDRLLSVDFVDVYEDLVPETVDDGCSPSAVVAPSIHKDTRTCIIDGAASGGRADFVTPSANYEGNRKAGPGVFECLAVPPSVGRKTQPSIAWPKHDINEPKDVITPLPFTPAKKPKVVPRMQDGFAISRRIASDSLVDGRGPKGATDITSSTNNVTSCSSCDVSASNGMVPILQGRKCYRHKVLLKLRKKQEKNNYDLARFLLVKFGGPGTAAGRSVIKDRALLECSALCCLDKSDVESFYQRDRAMLMTELSQRIAVHNLSASQLNRKLAKLLPPSTWFNHLKLHQKVTSQEKWNPFSIFGSALPYVDIKEVFDNVDCGKGASRLNEQSSNLSVANAPEPANRDNNGDEARENRCKGHTGHENTYKNVDTTPGINWSGDPLVLDEILWYLEATGKYVDKSKQVCVLQKCFCVTPNPQIAFNWNDSRNPVWKDYRGPRASMGQALSPSIYEESMLDYARLQDALEPIMEDKGLPSESYRGVSLSALEAEGARGSAHSGVTNVAIDRDCICSSGYTQFKGGFGTRSSNVNTPAPPKHHAKMQQLIYYRNYFKANRVDSGAL